MPGMRRGVGPVVAPRPVLELLKEPRYDTTGIANGNASTIFFTNPQGAVDATALTGAKTFSETNMVRAGAMSTPQLFDIYGISVKYQDTTSQADFQAFRNRGNFRLFIGSKEYLHVRADILPSDVGIVSDLGGTVASFQGTIGLQSTQNILDVTIPEEMLDPATNRMYLTGRRVPIHIPSEQNFSVTLEFPGTITLAGTRRTQVCLYGILKREVQ